MEMFDFECNPVKHHYARVNGIKMHYVIAGKGEPLLLLHGTPYTNFYWTRVMPLLTKDFTVIAPDLRGFGYSDKPGATEGYDSITMTTDIDELMSLSASIGSMSTVRTVALSTASYMPPDSQRRSLPCHSGRWLSRGMGLKRRPTSLRGT